MTRPGHLSEGRLFGQKSTTDYATSDISRKDRSDIAIDARL